MTIAEILQTLGINPAVLAAGSAGGILRALSRRQFKLREMIASPICGALAAAYLTLPTVHFIKVTGWPVPVDDESQVVLASAFLIGTCAMWISDIVFEIIVRRFKPKEAE